MTFKVILGSTRRVLRIAARPAIQSIHPTPSLAFNPAQIGRELRYPTNDHWQNAGEGLARENQGFGGPIGGGQGLGKPW